MHSKTVTVSWFGALATYLCVHHGFGGRVEWRALVVVAHVGVPGVQKLAQPKVCRKEGQEGQESEISVCVSIPGVPPGSIRIQPGPSLDPELTSSVYIRWSWDQVCVCGGGPGVVGREPGLHVFGT